MGAKLRALGFRAVLQAARRGPSCNLIARLGPAAARPLLLNTHTDTVPPGPARAWTSTGGDPWKASLRRGRLYGLGVADVKLNLLCQYWALRRFRGRAFKRPLCVAATYGEESGLLGAQSLVKAWKGPRPSFALVGEPSALRLIDRHRGYLVIEWTVPDVKGPAGGTVREVRFAGRAAHSSTPHLGVNAAERALQALRRWERAGRAPRVLSFTAGTAANQVPAEAVLRVALREGGGAIRQAGTAPGGGRRAASLVDWRAIAEGLSRMRRAVPPGHSFNVGVARRLKGATQIVFDVRFPPERSAAPLIRAARRALGRVRVERDNPGLRSPRPSGAWSVVRRALADCGLPAAPAAKATCTEAGIYSRWGVPAAVWGPGRSVGNIHRPNESIPLRDLDRAVAFYTALIEAWVS